MPQIESGASEAPALTLYALTVAAASAEEILTRDIASVVFLVGHVSSMDSRPELPASGYRDEDSLCLPVDWVNRFTYRTHPSSPHLVSARCQFRSDTRLITGGHILTDETPEDYFSHVADLIGRVSGRPTIGTPKQQVMLVGSAPARILSEELTSRHGRRTAAGALTARILAGNRQQWMPDSASRR